MSFLLRTARLTFIRPTLTIGIRPLTTTPVCTAASGYGDAKGDPVGGDPSAQGSSNKTTQNAEHPGPAPPAEGQGTGGGPTKGSSKGSKGSKTAGGKNPEDASAQSGGSRSKEAKETGSSPTGGEIKKGKSGGGGGGAGQRDGDISHKSADGQRAAGGAKPKILDPKDHAQAGGEEVKRHNQEFREGYDHGKRDVELR